MVYSQLRVEKAPLSAERLVRYENIQVQVKAGKHKASNKSGSCLSCSLSEQVSVAP